LGVLEGHNRANREIHLETVIEQVWRYALGGGDRTSLEIHIISKMYFSHWKPPGVFESMWSVNLDASISGEYQTLGGHSGRPSE